MNRSVSLPIAAALLLVILAGTTVIVRATKATEGPQAADPPHTAVAGFEPTAANVSGDLTARQHVLTRRVEGDPADTAAMLELARLLHDAHQPGEAVQYYQRYLEANPHNHEVWFDLADSHGRAGNWVAAREAMQALLERAPDDGTAIFNMGVIEAQLGNRAAAQDWLERAAGSDDPELAGRARAVLADLDARG